MLQLALNQSSRIETGVFYLGLLASLILGILFFQHWLLFGALLLSFATAQVFYRRYQQHAPEQITLLQQLQQQHWLLRTACDKDLDAYLQPHFVMRQFYVVLYFRLSDGKRLQQIIFRDQVPAESFRALRRFLLTNLAQSNTEKYSL